MQLGVGDGSAVNGVGNKKWDVVLLGGAMGSIFSLCQCVISPFLGARKCSRIETSVYILSRADTSMGDYIVSDKYGRRPVLLATMIGNIVSAGIWLQSTSFVSRQRTIGQGKGRKAKE